MSLMHLALPIIEKVEQFFLNVLYQKDTEVNQKVLAIAEVGTI